jgi:hypothetical protein
MTTMPRRHTGAAKVLLDGLKSFEGTFVLSKSGPKKGISLKASPRGATWECCQQGDQMCFAKKVAKWPPRIAQNVAQPVIINKVSS